MRNQTQLTSMLLLALWILELVNLIFQVANMFVGLRQNLETTGAGLVGLVCGNSPATLLRKPCATLCIPSGAWLSGVIPQAGPGGSR